MDLTFVLLHENSSNKCVAFKYFMSYFGFERFDLVMQNYVVICGLQTSLKSSSPSQSILFDNFKLHWLFCFPTQSFSFHDNLTILVPLSQSEMACQNTCDQQVVIAVYFYIQHCVCGTIRHSESSLLAGCDLRWTQNNKR